MTTIEGVAMVTGAGRGIGAAIAGRLAAAGATVAVCDLDGPSAEQTAKALGSGALGFETDVSSSPSISATVAAIGDRLGPISVLINNAGIDKIEPFVDSVEETWDRLWAVNLRGTISCCHAVLTTHMIPAGNGRIVNIGSDAGRVGSTGEAVYSATKGGIIAFTKTLAREDGALRRHRELRVPWTYRHRPPGSDRRGQSWSARQPRQGHPHAPGGPTGGYRSGGGLPGQR